MTVVLNHQCEETERSQSLGSAWGPGVAPGGQDRKQVKGPCSALRRPSPGKALPGVGQGGLWTKGQKVAVSTQGGPSAGPAEGVSLTPGRPGL